MKNICIRLVPFLLLCCTFVSCGKMDDLEGLDGQWQMTEWVDAQGEPYAGQDAQYNIAFQRENENTDAGCNTKQAGKHHKPPMHYRTAGSFSQFFKMSFHGTNN